MQRVDDGDDAAQPVVTRDRAVEAERRGDRSGIRDARRLDDDARERRQLAAHPTVVQRFERLLQRVAECAAQASRIEQHDVVLASRRDQHVVEPDLAELVDDHGRVRETRLAHQRAEQRRLAAAEKAGEDVDGQRRHRRVRIQPSVTAASGARTGNPSRYVFTSAVGITSTYLLLRSNRLIAWLASNRSNAHSSGTITLKLYENASTAVARRHPDVVQPARISVSTSKKLRWLMKIVPKKHDGLRLAMRMSCGRGASSATVCVACVPSCDVRSCPRWLLPTCTPLSSMSGRRALSV